ncbi:MAG: sugar ABC transporter permease [Chloroflexi bacterium]|nr:sugar ABC transporter permease [Chloroflexota bacterium]
MHSARFGGTSTGRAPTLAVERSQRGGPFQALSTALDHEATLGYVLVAPVVLILLGLVAYPLFYAIQLSLMDRTIGGEGKFVGLQTIVGLWDSSLYRQTLRNTLIFTAGATVMKLLIGFGVALLINEQFPGRKMVRAAILLPWIVPTVLSGMAWQWMFTPNFSVINWVLVNAGILKVGLPWLTSPGLALFCIMLVNAWRAVPFFAITLLAGLQTIPAELYEASAIDGAGRWHRFRYVTFPLIAPILTITLVLSIIWTFSDFQTVYSLTKGGPMNSTHVLGTLSYQIGLQSGKISEGVAISLTMLPLLLLLVIFQLRQLRQSGGA